MTPPRDPDHAQLDAVFFALASEPRRRILDLLKLEPGCNVNRVCAGFDTASGLEITRFAVMKHLATLEGAGLVVAQRVGRERLLWFDPTPIQWIHERWTTEFSAYWASRLTHLKRAAEGAELLQLAAPAAPRSTRATPKPPAKGRRRA